MQPTASPASPENPIGFAIGAMATGFVIGMLLPATHIEDERLGEVSDRVKAQVQEAGHEALEHAKSVGQAALSEGAEDVVEILEGEAPVEAAESGDSTRERAGEAPADLDD